MSKAVTKYDRVMSRLRNSYPGLSDKEYRSSIMRLREASGGTLKGFTVDNVITEMASIIRSNHTQTDLKSDDVIEPVAFEPLCCICHELLFSQIVIETRCGHEFHELCLKKWLDVNKTCPTCRKLTLLEDEFPSL